MLSHEDKIKLEQQMRDEMERSPQKDAIEKYDIGNRVLDAEQKLRDVKLSKNLYTLSEEDATRTENNFTYHPPHGKQPERYEYIRQEAKYLATVLIGQCPRSRELSLALTKLEEAVMWGMEAIARNEKP